MKSLKNAWIPLGLLGLSFCLRFLLISKGPYHIDCLKLIMTAEEFLKTGHLGMQSGLGFPLTVMLSAAFIRGVRLLGMSDPVFAVNLMSVVTSSVSVLMLYWWVKNLLDTQTALLSSLLFAVSPIFWGLSVYGKSHAPCLLFLLLGLFFLERAARGGSQKFLAISAVCFGFMGATRIIDLVLLSIPLSFFLLNRYAVSGVKEKNVPAKRGKTLCLFWCTAAAVTVAFYIPMLFTGEWASQKSLFLNDVRIGLWENFLGLASPRLSRALEFLNTNTTPVGLLLAVFGLVTLAFKKKALAAFLFLWLIFPFFFYGNLRMTVTSRYFVILLPPLYIAIGYALTRLTSGHKIKTFLGLVLFIMLWIYAFRYMYPTLKVRHHNAILPAYVQWVAKTAGQDATIICADESSFFKYYTDMNVISRPLRIGSYSQETLEAFGEKIDALLQQKTPLYIHGGSLYAYNKDNQFYNFIYDRYKLRYLGSHFYEDWHLGAMELQVHPFDLYRIEKKGF